VTPTVDGRRTRAGLRSLRDAFHAAAGQTVRAGVEAAKASAVASGEFKDRSGGTRASIEGHVEGLRGMVSASGAMRMLVSGTRPHTIVAHGKALRFVVNGEVLYRRMVRHPGTKPRPIMHHAAEAGALAMHAAAEYYVGEAIAHAHG
jgi:hypothetical protein